MTDPSPDPHPALLTPTLTPNLTLNPNPSPNPNQVAKNVDAVEPGVLRVLRGCAVDVVAAVVAASHPAATATVTYLPPTERQRRISGGGSPRRGAKEAAAAGGTVAQQYCDQLGALTDQLSSASVQHAGCRARLTATHPAVCCHPSPHSRTQVRFVQCLQANASQKQRSTHTSCRPPPLLAVADLGT